MKSFKFLNFSFLLILTLGVGISVYAFVHMIPQYSATTTKASCNSTGVTKNPSGKYVFAALHVDTQGNMADNSGCIIHLAGTNMGWMDSNSVDIPSSATITQWKQVIPFNVVRLAINSVWYNADLKAPNYPARANDMKSLLKNYIQNQENAGNYVELDIDQQYAYPPCDPKNKTAKCYPQGQADTDFAKQPAYCRIPYAQEVQQNLFADPNCLGDREEEAYQPPATAALADLAKTYGNDPAIIFDVWNEPPNANPEKMTYPDFRTAMDTRIQTVRQYTNNLIEVYTAWIQNLPQSPYTESNLVMDYHTYHPDFSGNKLLSYISAFHAHGQAVIINEYGGTQYSPTVQTALINLGTNYDVGSLYFGIEHLLSSKNPFTLNPWGLLVNLANNQILGLAPTVTPST